MNWDLVTADKLTREQLDALFDDDIAAIQIPHFVDEHTRDAAVKGILARGFDYYRDVDPPIGRIGITQFEHRHDTSSRIEYFRLARAATAEREAMFDGSGDIVGLVIEALEAVWPGAVTLAGEPDGATYFAGLVRVITEGLLHCDWAPFDAPSWAIGAVDAQITWNLYCQLPATGGTTVVYRRRWEPEAETQHIVDSYGYSEALVAGCPSVRIQPTPGSLVFFNSRNFHRIERSGGDLRISVSSFVGRFRDGRLALWS